MIEYRGLKVYSYVPNDNGGYDDLDKLPPDKRKEWVAHLSEGLGKGVEEMYRKNPKMLEEHYKRGIVHDP